MRTDHRAATGETSPTGGAKILVFKRRRSGGRASLPQISDPLLDLLQPSRSLRLQALTFGTTLIPGTLSDLLQP